MDFVEYVLSLPSFILIVYFFVTGSIFGSFANVLIHRTLRMIQEEEEREGEKSPLSGEEQSRTDQESPLSESDSKGQPLNESDTIHPGDSKTHSEDNNPLQGVSSLSLKDRFMDRISQHLEFFYCLFLFCVKKPLQFVYRRILFFIKFLQSLNQEKGKQFSFFNRFFVFWIKNPLKAFWFVCRVNILPQDLISLNLKEHPNRESDEKNKPHSSEQGESFPLDLMGHSRCPHCNYKIPFYLNIPILSWFFLRGRCRNCQAGISFRYPLVEFLMACLFTGLFILVGWKWFLLEALIFVFGLVVVSFIDWDRMILPSFFTLPGIYLGLVGGFLNPERAFSSAVIGWLAGGFILWLSGYLYFKIRNQEGMGDGDVSLMGWIGAVLGWQSISFVLICSCFFGVIFGIGSILRNRADTRTPFPFGPCLAVGAVCYLFIQFLAPDILRLFSPL